MPVNLVAEDDLRQALRPYRCDADSFEAGIRQRLAAADAQPAPDPLVGVSPLLRSAAAFLPLGILVGCKTAPSGVREAPAGWGHLLLGYLAFPAISLFFLLGAAIFSVLGLRSLKGENNRELDDLDARNEAIRKWWSDNKRGAQAVFAISLVLAFIGKAWLLFLLYVVSFGILLYVVAAFARRGLGDRAFVARACASGLMLLGQLAAFGGIGLQDIHFLDQRLVAALFFAGGLILLPFGLPALPAPEAKTAKLPIWIWFLIPVTLGLLLKAWLAGPSKEALVLGVILMILAAWGFRAVAAGWRIGTSVRVALALALLVQVPLIAWLTNSILLPATPARIRNSVESFDHAEYSTVSWRWWEIAAEWVRRSAPDLDLSKPRGLLAQEIAGDQNPFILGTAMRVGLLQSDQVVQLKYYSVLLRDLVAERPLGLKPQIITSLEQYDWVIRAAVLRNDLSPEERNRLQQRLQATLNEQWGNPHLVLSDVLRVTQLLELLGRPVDVDHERARVHDLLRTFHTKHGGGFQLAGGFRKYSPSVSESAASLPGDLEPTADAVELMETYGIPAGLDLNWVRSFLRPSISRRSGDQWAAAATLDRLNHLPGAPQPTWTDRLYHERPLLAALVLVGLCLYATLCSPVPTLAKTPIVEGTS